MKRRYKFLVLCGILIATVCACVLPAYFEYRKLQLRAPLEMSGVDAWKYAEIEFHEGVGRSNVTDFIVLRAEIFIMPNGSGRPLWYKEFIVTFLGVRIWQHYERV